MTLDTRHDVKMKQPALGLGYIQQCVAVLSVGLDHTYTTMSDEEYPPVKQSTGQTEEEQARCIAHCSRGYR